MALRTPTSLARFSERAVLKFMKLIQAKSNTKMPTMPNSQTYSINPPVFTPSFQLDFKCQSAIGCKKIRASKRLSSLGKLLNFERSILLLTVSKSTLSAIWA